MNKEFTGLEDIHISHELSTRKGLSRETAIGTTETDNFYSYKSNRQNIILRSAS